MTYSHCEYHPSSRANLLIGPNGSGKSSVVCALILGLGGTPKDMERGRELKDFVLKGAGGFEITIDLAGRDPEQTISVTRVFKLSGDAFWLIDNTKRTFQDVKNITTELNIRVDSLTSFLPQEKVGAFTRMNDQQLLMETEKAIGDGKLYEHHTELIEASQQASTSLHEAAALDTQRTSLQVTVDAMEQELASQSERQEFLNKAEKIQRGLPWIRVLAQHSRRKQAKSAAKEAAVTLTKCATALDEAQSLVDSLPSTSSSSGVAGRDAASKLHKAQADVNQLKSDARAHMAAMRRTGQNIEHEVKAFTMRESKQQAARENLARARAELAAADNQDDLASILADASAKMQTAYHNKEQHEHTVKQLRSKVESAKRALVRAENKRTQLQNFESQRVQALQTLSGQNQDLKVALQLYERMKRDQFAHTAPVYAPAALHTRCADGLAAAMLNDALKSVGAATVVVTEVDDMRRCMSVNLGTGGRTMKVTAHRVVDPAATLSAPPKIRADVVRGLMARGWRGLLSDAVEAPDAVKAFLYDKGIQSIVYGEERLLADLVAHPDILDSLPAGARLMTPAGGFTVRESRMSHTRSVARTYPSSNTAEWFSAGASKEQEAAAEAEYDELRSAFLAAQKAEMEALSALAALDEAANGAKALEQQARDRLREVVKLRQSVSVLESEVQQFKSATAGSTKEQVTLQVAQRRHDLLRMMQCLGRVDDVVCTAVQQVKAEVSEHLAASGLRKARSTLEERLLAARDAHDEAKHHVAVTDRDRQKESEAYAEARARANAESGDVDTDPELAELVRTLTDRKQEGVTYDDFAGQLEAEVRALRRAAQEVCADANLPRRLDQKKRELAQVVAKQDEFHRNQSRSEAVIAERKQRWINSLTSQVAHVSGRFQKSMARLRIQAYVQLCKPEEDQHDFKRWGLQMCAAFRTGIEPQPVNAHTNSGGERALCTMMFLLALQRSTPCPFRVIDEINQGMDKAFERQVMTQVMHACAPGKLAYTRAGVPDQVAEKLLRARAEALGLRDGEDGSDDEDLVEEDDAHHAIGQQYFIITPKLLPDLVHAEHVRTTTVFNGPFLSSVVGVGLQEQLEALRNGKVAPERLAMYQVHASGQDLGAGSPATPDLAPASQPPVPSAATPSPLPRAGTRRRAAAPLEVEPDSSDDDF